MDESPDTQETNVKNKLQAIGSEIQAIRVRAGVTQIVASSYAVTSIRRWHSIERGLSTPRGAREALETILENPVVFQVAESDIVRLRASLQVLREYLKAPEIRYKDIHSLSNIQVRSIRKILGLTQAQLAGILGLKSLVSVSQWERKMNPVVPRAYYRSKLIKLGADAVGKSRGLTGESAETALYNAIELLADVTSAVEVA